MMRITQKPYGAAMRYAAAVLLFVGSLLGRSRVPVAAGGAASGLDMKFVTVVPGEFMMGCSEGDESCNADEHPLHRVRITKAFDIGAYEVTQAQWTSVMGTNPSASRGDTLPVETVSRTEVDDFLSQLNARNDGNRYRLPTEAEWEYAARAGMSTPREGSLEAIGWYAGNSDDESHPVGGKKPNAWGLYDMLGNVREWVADQYSATYYASSPTDDPIGPPPGQGGRGRRGGRPGGPRGGRFGPPPDFAGDFGPPPPPPDGFPPEFGPPDGPPPQGAANQEGNPNANGGRGRGRRGGGPPNADLPVIRGGAWDNPASYLRVSARYNYYGPTLRVSDLGFRVVRVSVAQ
jgi:formylglycine-generating enzyme required for sulfatase activity